MSSKNKEVSPAKQERSRRSAAELIKAAESLIEEHGFEQMSLRDVCRRAGVTSGAFYGRFSKKLDLALVLADDVGQACIDIATRFSKRLPDKGIRTGIRELLKDSIGLYRKRGALFRVLIATARTYPELAQRMRIVNDKTFAILIPAFKPFYGSLAHDKPEKAVQLGLFCILNALREMILEQQLFDKKQSVQTASLVNELTTLFLNYVGVSDE